MRVSLLAGLAVCNGVVGEMNKWGHTEKVCFYNTSGEHAADQCSINTMSHVRFSFAPFWEAWLFH